MANDSLSESLIISGGVGISLADEESEHTGFSVQF